MPETEDVIWQFSELRNYGFLLCRQHGHSHRRTAYFLSCIESEETDEVAVALARWG